MRRQKKPPQASESKSESLPIIERIEKLGQQFQELKRELAELKAERKRFYDLSDCSKRESPTGEGTISP